MGKRIIKILKPILDSVLDIIYPEKSNCINCYADDYIGLCPKCINSIKRIKTEEKIKSFAYYNGAIKKLILELKYKNNFLAAKILGEFISALIKENNIEADVILYVPLSKRSYKKRGYNQSKLIANIVSEKCNIEISNSLIKVKNTKEQKTLSKDERMSNLIDAFYIKDYNEVKNKRVILIDDVVTTGATLLECEKILKKFNASTINILTVAKSNI
ncbi:ComF family protein [Clostridium septicum]|uniref:ComF family protein n=1 Tax=Clostridium septicum TaxID=1504 RepID=UPI00272E6919|nr:ComF family protein [Clostridium septicum]WLF69915.1 ComF family protein [Clostridium septicum]